jgi:hypothetical protein
MPITAFKATVDEAREAKRASEAAWEYFHRLFPGISSVDVDLEEVELSPDGKQWLVTLSYREMRKKSVQLPDFLRVPRQKFKVFKVDRSSGKVVSMKMRNGG